MTATVAASIFFIAIAMLPAFMAVEGVVTGTVRARGGRCSRAQQPALFWFVVTIDVALVLWFAWLALRLATGA